MVCGEGHKAKMTKDNWLVLFQKAQAIQKGHFLLSSGLHSDTYFQMARVFQNPGYGEKCSLALAKCFAGEQIDTVIGPALGGVLLSYELAKALKAKSLFSEREADKMVLRRGFQINPGEKILVCEDVITTGGSVQEVIKLVENSGGNIKGVACLVERGKVDFGYPLKSLVKISAAVYQPADCPLCQGKITLVKPGSRKILKQDS